MGQKLPPLPVAHLELSPSGHRPDVALPGSHEGFARFNFPAPAGNNSSMTPVTFPEATHQFRPPPDLEESQCHTIHAYSGTVDRGSLEGSYIVVTAWKPTPQEIMKIRAGRPIFLTCIGSLPPHMLTMSFAEASQPA